jgi:hypothetical protein
MCQVWEELAVLTFRAGTYLPHCTASYASIFIATRPSNLTKCAHVTFRTNSYIFLEKQESLFLSGFVVLKGESLNFAGMWRHVFGQVVPDVSNDTSSFLWRLESQLYSWPWRWPQHVPPKHGWSPAKLQVIINLSHHYNLNLYVVSFNIRPLYWGVMRVV